MSILVLDIDNENMIFGIGGTKIPYSFYMNHGLKKGLNKALMSIDNNSFNKLILDSAIITDPLIYSKYNKKKINKYLKKNGFKKVVYIKRQLLMLYNFGKDYGLIIDIGDIIKFVAFYDSFCLDNSIAYIKKESDISIICEKIRHIIKKIPIDLRKQIASNIYIIGSHYDKLNLSNIIDYLDDTYVYTIYIQNNSSIAWLGGSIISQVPHKINWINL